MTTNLPEVLYKGSVKNVRGNASDDFVFFEFSDRYSIFDWGEMPDLIPNKGLSLARFTDAIYQLFSDANAWKGWTLPNTYHTNVLSYLQRSLAYRKICNQGMLTHRFGADARINNLWKVKKVFVPKITDQNYDFYQSKPIDTLVPLEVIFRFGTPSGSSLFKRLEKNPDYMYSLGIEQMPKEMQWFDRPIIEFSTKLESSDRYLSYGDAKKIANLSEEEFELLYSYTSLLAIRLREEMQQMDLQLWDGKFEFAFTKGEINRDFMLVDSIGPDELRITHQNIHLSKEVLRQVYLSTDWYRQVEAFKKRYTDWQEQMQERDILPNSLAMETRLDVEFMYTSLADAVESYFVKKQKSDLVFDEVVSRLRRDFRRETM